MKLRPCPPGKRRPPFDGRTYINLRHPSDSVIFVLSESHLRRILGTVFDYYHEGRTHLGLEKETPKA